jgi:hypothetical protein
LSESARNAKPREVHHDQFQNSGSRDGKQLSGVTMSSIEESGGTSTYDPDIRPTP